MTKKINYLLRRRRPKKLTGLVRLREYAQSEYVDESTVRHWIATRKIVGYHLKGRWWIDPDSRFRVPLYDGSNPLVGL